MRELMLQFTMNTAAGSTEIRVLIASAVYLLALILAQAIALDLTGNLSPRYLLGSRDEGRVSTSILAARLSRAHGDFLRSYPAFIVLVFLLMLQGKAGGVAAIGAVIWLAAWFAHMAGHLFDHPAVRFVTWWLSLFGLALMLLQLLL